MRTDPIVALKKNSSRDLELGCELAPGKHLVAKPAISVGSMAVDIH